MFGYVYRPYEFNHRIYSCVYIKTPILESVFMFSNPDDAQRKINECKNMEIEFNSELTPPYNIIVAYLDAAYGNGGYLCSNIKNHQLYITNSRG